MCSASSQIELYISGFLVVNRNARNFRPLGIKCQVSQRINMKRSNPTEPAFTFKNQKCDLRLFSTKHRSIFNMIHVCHEKACVELVSGLFPVFLYEEF